MTFARIALDVPLPKLFDYRAASATTEDIGRRVLVPFGNKVAVGVIMALVSSTSLPPQRVRSVLDILRDVPPLPADVLELLEFCSDYYHHPVGEVVLNALPTRLRRRQRVDLASAWNYRLTAAGWAINPKSLPARASTKRQLLCRLHAAPAGLEETTLRALAAGAPRALKSMEAQGWVERMAAAGNAASKKSALVSPTEAAPPTLNPEQSAAIAQVRDAGAGFAPWLLLGITGSGKTEIYLHLIANALARGEQALVLVPEINLTPQFEARVRARFPFECVVTLHSGMNDSERLHNWLAAQAGRSSIVLGTRLAVFTPLPKLGLIVVDEENDASFKQMDGLRYSARDVALMRAKQRAVPIVLGSATPALESFHQAQRGRYRTLSLPHRINATLPAITCVDTRRESLIDGLAPTLLAAVRATLKRREQCLIFINRRGYAPVLLCRGCGWNSGCPRCSAKLVLHLAAQRLRCHHCGHQERIPAACPDCGNQDLTPVGQGTQRIESALARVFPAARILRIDRDSTRRRHAWTEMRRQIHALEVDILVGTQILAKGHDFPELNLVGVINADSSLYSTDFRASERLFARLTQVAGRAGRGSRAGEVLIQTEFPEHPLYLALKRHDYKAFAHELLAERRQAGFPPFVHQAVLRAEAPKMETALEFLAHVARDGGVRAHAVTLYDPVPAGMPRLAGVERAQLTVQSRSRIALHAFLRAWRVDVAAAAGRKVRWALDIDPLEV